MSRLSHRLYQLLWRLPLPLKRKKTLYKRLCKQGESPSVPFTTDFFGLQYQGNLNNSIEFNIFYFGAFEKPLLFFLRDASRSLAGEEGTSRFCDIGANIGQHSLFMSRHVDQVFAFEPFAGVGDKLLRHIELNAIQNIEFHAVGLSDAQGEQTYYAPTGHNQGIGSFDADSQVKGNVPAGELALVRGDDFFDSRDLAGKLLVKIDVEGFEKKVIQGLSNTLQRCRPLIVCEISYGNPASFQSAGELQEALPDDYRLLCFDTRKPDGSKARRRGARGRSSGEYRIIEFDRWFDSGQDDVIACPAELLPVLPRSNP